MQLRNRSVNKPQLENNEKTPKKKSSFIKRLSSFGIMVGGISLVIAMGHFYCAVIVVILASFIFHEVLTLGKNQVENHSI